MRITQDASFIEYPPIPYQKRYKADVRPNTNSTSKQPTVKRGKLRSNNGHPLQQQSDSEPASGAESHTKEEYYVMGGGGSVS